MNSSLFNVLASDRRANFRGDKWLFLAQISVKINNDYYDRCSAGQFLATIRRPTLIINALDAPFMTPRAIPAEERLSNSVQIEVSAIGGHVGFVGGELPWRSEYYLPARIIGFLQSSIGEATRDARPLPGM